MRRNMRPAPREEGRIIIQYIKSQFYSSYLVQTTPPCLCGIAACVVASPFNDNDDDKRLGLTTQADQYDHKKIQYTKNKN